MSEPRVIWSPLKGSQSLAISCPCHHILYEGTRGPGKTDVQIMYFRRYVGMGYGSFWRGIIFDREYKNLDDLVAKSQRWFPQFKDGAKFLASKSDYKWVWPTGEELLFRVIKTIKDYWNFHGQEYPFIGWNELTKFPTSELYDMMMSCNRSSFLPAVHNPNIPEIPSICFATTNPYGAGHNWVKNKFIDAAEPGKIVRTATNVFNPRTQERMDIVKTQVRLFGSYKENIYLSPEYVAELEGITDDNRRRAWLWGDWDVVAGGAIDDVWGTHNIVDRFPIPAGWRVDRSMDWGSTHPFSVGWWAESNGEEVTYEGKGYCFPKGSLIRIAEWYGSEKIGSNKGLTLSATDVAEGIKKREAELLADGWIQRKPLPGPADNQINNDNNVEVDSIALKMSKAGIHWNQSIKTPGSRINGLVLFREMLAAAREREQPGCFFMRNCGASLATLPVLPRDENKQDDVDTDSEDHIYDEVRYRVLALKRGAQVSTLHI